MLNYAYIYKIHVFKSKRTSTKKDIISELLDIGINI